MLKLSETKIFSRYRPTSRFCSFYRQPLKIKITLPQHYVYTVLESQPVLRLLDTSPSTPLPTSITSYISTYPTLPQSQTIITQKIFPVLQTLVDSIADSRRELRRVVQTNYTLQALNQAFSTDSKFTATINTYSQLMTLIAPEAHWSKLISSMQTTNTPFSDFLFLSELAGTFNMINPAVRAPLLESFITGVRTIPLETRKKILQHLSKMNFEKYNMPQTVPQHVARMVPSLYHQLISDRSTDLQTLNLLEKVFKTPITTVKKTAFRKILSTKTAQSNKTTNQSPKSIDELIENLSSEAKFGKDKPNPQTISGLLKTLNRSGPILPLRQTQQLMDIYRWFGLSITDIFYTDFLRQVFLNMLEELHSSVFSAIKILRFLLESDIQDNILIGHILEVLSRAKLDTLSRAEQATLHLCLHCLSKLHSVETKIDKKIEEHLGKLCNISNSSHINRYLEQNHSDHIHSDLYCCLLPNQRDSQQLEVVSGFSNTRGTGASSGKPKNNVYEQHIVACLQHFLDPQRYTLLVKPRFCTYEIDIGLIIRKSNDSQQKSQKQQNAKDTRASDDSELIFLEIHGMQYKNQQGALKSQNKLKRRLCEAYGIRTVYLDVSQTPLNRLIEFYEDPKKNQRLYDIIIDMIEG